MRLSAGPERRRASCEQPELIEYDRGWPPATSLKGARGCGRLRQRRHGRQNNAQNNDSDGRGNQHNGLPKPFDDLQRDSFPWRAARSSEAKRHRFLPLVG
jgi:hypothetical protein